MAATLKSCGKPSQPSWIGNQPKPTGKEYDGRTATADREARSIEAYRESRQARMFSNQAAIRVNERNTVPSVAETVGNLFDEINWDYAVIERINRKDLSVSLVPFQPGACTWQRQRPRQPSCYKLATWSPCFL